MNKYKILLVFMLIFIVSLACNYPTPSPTPSREEELEHTAAVKTLHSRLTRTAENMITDEPPTPTPTPTKVIVVTTTSIPPTPTPTDKPLNTPTYTLVPTPEVSDDPAIFLGDPTWTENFKSSEGWYIYKDSHINLSSEDSKLKMTIYEADRWRGWIYSNHQLTDFYYEITASPSACSGRDNYGLVFRGSGVSNTYLFGFSCDGRYHLMKWNGEKFFNLASWVESDLINSGEGGINRMGVWAEGNQLTLYANGERLTTVTDNSYNSGNIGLYISSYTTPGFSVFVTKASYWEIP